MIRAAAQRRLADWRDEGRLEAVVENGNGGDGHLWKEARCELGWAGIAIDETCGGAGLGLLGRAVLMEEMGAALFSAPFFASSCLAADHIAAFGTEEKKQGMLSALAAGDMTAAFVDGRGQLELKGQYLSGAVDYIVDGSLADQIVVLVAESVDEFRLYAILVKNEGVQIAPHRTMDPTRGLARIEFQNVLLNESALIGQGGDVELRRARGASAISLAAECVGGAQRCLDMTVAYANDRVQFDRPIALFQAVKHRCADMMIAVEASRSAAYGAAASEPESWPEMGALALGVAGESFFKVAGDAIQMHGGIGFTWEYPLHFYFKRARANRVALGAPSAHYEELADIIGLDRRGARS